MMDTHSHSMFILFSLFSNLVMVLVLADETSINGVVHLDTTPRSSYQSIKTNGPEISMDLHNEFVETVDRHEQHEAADHNHEKHEIHRYHVAKVDFPHVSTPYIISIWILIAGLAKIGFHVTPKLGLIFPESCVLIVVGVIIGLILFYTGIEQVGPLTPEVFFLYMLPPIILDAGYFMPNRLFFDNMGSILVYAVIGTVWNVLTIGFSLWAIGLTGLYGLDIPLLDILLFSSIVSAVDPVAVLAVFEEIHVNEVLYILVFGESLLNDAVTVVLYHMFEGYTEMGQENIIPIDYLAGVLSFFVASLGGAFFGVLWGIIAAVLSRFTHHVLIIEPLFIFVLGYLSYLTSELFHLSGIVALTFCGITMKNYVEENITYKSHVTLKYAMKMLANSSETIIFMFLGVSIVNDEHDWNTWFVILTVIFCTVYRTIGVVIQTWVLNMFRIHKVNWMEQFIMAYGGLRGAVAFALVLVISEDVIPSKKIMVTTIIVMVFFTVFVQGITVGPLVKLLKVPRSNKTKPSMNERLHTRLIDHLMAGIEDIAGHRIGNYLLRDKFRHYNNRFIRPLLTRDHRVREPKIFETYSKLNLADAMNLVKQNNSMVSVIGSGQSISLSNLIKTYTQTNLARYSDGIVSSSQTSTFQNESSFANLDIGELEYSPSCKDLADAELHHILNDSMFSPPRRVRRYSRDMIDETAPHPPFHHKTRMQIRRVLNDKNRKKRKGNHHKHIMNGHFYNGKELKSHKKGSQGKINTDLKPHKAAILRFNLPTSISEISEVEDGSPKNENHSYSNVVFTQDDEGITFTAPTPLSESDVDILSSDFNRISHPTKEFRPLTLTETTLPWKREENCTDRSCVQKQQEFPPWVENKEYHAYSSLTKTFLGKINPNSDIKPPNVFAVFGIEKPIKDEEVNMKNGNTKTVDSFISQTENADTASVEDGYFLNQIQPENLKEEQFEMKKQNTGVQASLCTGVNDERENSSQVEEPHDFVIDMSDQKGLISKRL